MWTIIAAVVAVLLASYYYLKDYDFFEKRGIPYAKPFPFFGCMFKAVTMQTSLADMVKEVYNVNREAKYTGLFDFMTPVVLLRDLDLIRSITIKNAETFPNHRVSLEDGLEPLLSKNLFNLRGERWKEVRMTLSPAFTSSKMKSMFVLMRECAKQYGDIMCTLREDQRILELKDTFTRCTNDLIATCAFGVNVDSMVDCDNKFYVYGREAAVFGGSQSIKLFAMRSFPKLCKLLGIRIVRKEITDFFQDLVATTIKTREEKGIVRPDMIQLMMESRDKLSPGKEMTIEDMTAQAFVFFFGGFENTSSLMCFTAYEIGVNEEIQKRLQDEIDQVLEDCNGEVTYEALNNMKYLDAVINETLRMYPTVVFTDRVCASRFELPPTLPKSKPLVIEKDQIVWIPIYAIHHDPDIYPDPEKFDPDRFYDDPKKILNSGAFLTFGQGPRICIGNRFTILEAKTVLFHLFAKCSLKPCSKTTIPMKLSKSGFSTTAENGFWFDVQPRNKPQYVHVNSVRGEGISR